MLLILKYLSCRISGIVGCGKVVDFRDARITVGADNSTSHFPLIQSYESQTFSVSRFGA